VEDVRLQSTVDASETSRSDSLFVSLHGHKNSYGCGRSPESESGGFASLNQFTLPLECSPKYRTKESPLYERRFLFQVCTASCAVPKYLSLFLNFYRSTEGVSRCRAPLPRRPKTLVPVDAVGQPPLNYACVCFNLMIPSTDVTPLGKAEFRIFFPSCSVLFLTPALSFLRLVIHLFGGPSSI